MATWRALCYSPAAPPFTGMTPPFAEKRFPLRAGLRYRVDIRSQRRKHE
jgi:hypothetical protein